MVRNHIYLPVNFFQITYKLETWLAGLNISDEEQMRLYYCLRKADFLHLPTSNDDVSLATGLLVETTVGLGLGDWVTLIARS